MVAEGGRCAKKLNHLKYFGNGILREEKVRGFLPVLRSLFPGDETTQPAPLFRCFGLDVHSLYPLRCGTPGDSL
jgi:hypothetical protein